MPQNQNSLLPTIIGAAAPLVGSAFNAINQGAMNRKTRKWNEKMYRIQRQDALADWALQNQYNHPSAQMARLRESGLNPALVYGGGATTEAAAVRSTDVKGWNPRAPEVDFNQTGQELARYFDYEVKQAQVDNLRTQNTVLTQDAVLKAAQVISTLAGTEKTKQDTASAKFDLELKNELRQTSVEAAKAGLRKLNVETQATFDANERAQYMKAPTFQKAVEEIMTLRLGRKETERRMELMNLDKLIKQYEVWLNAQGLQKNDPLIQREAKKIIDKVTALPGKALREIKQYSGPAGAIKAFQGIADFFRPKD